MNWNFLINKIKTKNKKDEVIVEKKPEIEIKNISKRALMGNPRRDK
jgi:hypothetical protein